MCVVGNNKLAISCPLLKAATGRAFKVPTMGWKSLSKRSAVKTRSYDILCMHVAALVANSVDRSERMLSPTA